MWEASSTEMASTGYEQKETYSDIVATATAEERVVAITSERVIDIETGSELSETEIPLSVNGDIDDVAIGRDSYVFLVVDGKLTPYSTTGTVGGPWAESVSDVAALDDSKLAIATLDDGRVRGFRAHNGLERFTISPLKEEADAVNLEIVAGRKRFLTYAESTLRCFDDRGSEQFEATFDSPIRAAGFLSDSVLVSLESGTVLWVDESGAVQRETECDLTAVSACGERLLFGSGNGAVKVFGQSGIMQQIVDERPDGIMQTARDSYASVIDDGKLHLFQRQSPSTDVQIESSDEGGTLVVDVENPFRVSLNLLVEVDSETTDSSILVPPRFSETTKIQLPSFKPGKAVPVWIGTDDRSIVTYDQEIAYDLDQEQESDTTEQTGKAEYPLELNQDPKSPKSKYQKSGSSSKSRSIKDKSFGTTKTTDSKSRDSGGGGREKSGEHTSGDWNFNRQGTEQDLAGETDAETNTESDNLESPTTSPGEERDESILINCSLARIVNNSYEWEISVENTAEDPISDVTLDLERPVKFTFENGTTASTDLIDVGEEFIKTASCPRSGTVSISVTWTDAAGGEHEQEVSNKVTVPDIDVRATIGTKRREAEFDRMMADHIEFYFKNPLSVPIHDTVSIDTQQASFPDLVGRQSITLLPGENIVTLGAPEEVLPDEGIAGKFHIKFDWLRVEMDVEAYPESGINRGGAPSYTRDLYSPILEEKDGERFKTQAEKHLDEISPDLPEDVLRETITIRNNTDSRLGTGVLTPGSADEESIAIPTLSSGSKVIYQRFWQYLGDQRGSLTLPEYDLQGFDTALYLSGEPVSIETKHIVPRVAIVKLGLDRSPKLLVNINEGYDGKVSLSGISLLGTPYKIDVNDFQLSSQNTVRILDLPEEFTQQTFDGIVIIKFKGKKLTFEKFAVVHEIQSPPITDQEQWFEASAASTTDGDDVQVTIENVAGKRKIQDIVVTAVPSEDAEGEASHSRDRVEVSELIQGQSISYVYSTTDTDTDSLLLDVEASYEDDRVNNRILVRSEESNDEDDWVCSVIPTEKNVDLDALTDSTYWPEWLSTEWQLLRE